MTDRLKKFYEKIKCITIDHITSYQHHSKLCILQQNLRHDIRNLQNEQNESDQNSAVENTIYISGKAMIDNEIYDRFRNTQSNRIIISVTIYKSRE